MTATSLSRNQSSSSSLLRALLGRFRDRFRDFDFGIFIVNRNRTHLVSVPELREMLTATQETKILDITPMSRKLKEAIASGRIATERGKRGENPVLPFLLPGDLEHEESGEADDAQRPLMPA